jgi:hypothetical protein
MESKTKTVCGERQNRAAMARPFGACVGQTGGAITPAAEVTAVTGGRPSPTVRRRCSSPTLYSDISREQSK